MLRLILLLLTTREVGCQLFVDSCQFGICQLASNFRHKNSFREVLIWTTLEL